MATSREREGDDMHRRDYELIAGEIRIAETLFKSNTSHAKFAARMAETLKVDNSRFNMEVFMQACMPRWIPGTRHESAWDKQTKLLLQR